MSIWKAFLPLKKRLGLVSLFILLILLNLFSLKPQFYLLGWDNFSSYFNLKTNLFRTFFSSWREYRGLGVPSDSETVDLFRQIFFLFLSPLVKTNLLGQIYVLVCLNIGVLGMYFFAHRFFQYAFTKKGHKYLDLAAFTASFFYLFNLNALATFYFPMVMYITRFASLPILFFVFFKLIKEKTINPKAWVLAILLFLFTSIAYLTATTFIAFLLIIAIFTLFLGNYRRQVLVYLLFIGINLFWLLPLANYTLEKSEIIKLAPTFIEVNESQLNKPASFYAPDRLLLLYPNFFDTKITNIAESDSHYLHPSVSFFNNPWPRAVLSIFPLFYLAGIVMILIKYRKKVFLWIPVIIVLSLFLVGKDYTPLGFIYRLIEDWVPYFKILFRFADTKFNPFISFAGSMAAALFFLSLLTSTSQYLPKLRTAAKVFFLTPLLLAVLIFSSYFKGNLIGFFMYNQIPEAYFQIAEAINKDKTNFRVLHLPLSKIGYWRSHVWGMVGSSFLNFMIDRPLIDRTFEPASMENAYLHQAISQLVDNAQAIENQEELEAKSTKLYQLLRKVGVKYIIWDETVSRSVYSRGAVFWGKFNTFDAKALIESLKESGQVQVKAEYGLNILDYLHLYPQQYPLDQNTIDYLTKNPHYSIQLLEIKDPFPKMYFAQKAESVDPDLDNLLETRLISPKQDYLQDKNRLIDLVFPFQREDASLIKNGSDFILNLKNPFEKSGTYLVELKENGREERRHYVEIFARTDEEYLVISLYRLPLPIIQGQKISESLGQIKIPLGKIGPYFSQPDGDFENFFTDWKIVNFKEISQLRLSINNYIFPLPTISQLDSEEKYLGTVVLSEGEIEIEVLAKDKSKNLNLIDFQLTEDPNCFQDKLNDYDSALKTAEGKLLLSSKNGSTCFWRDITYEVDEKTAHLEIGLNLESKNKDLDNLYPENLTRSAKPLLRNYLLKHPKPNLLRICVKGAYTDDCLNKHQALNLKRKQIVVVPLEKSIKGAYRPSILLATKNMTFQEQEIIINSLTLNQFKTVSKAELEVKPMATSYKIHLDSSKELSLKIPKALSLYSYYFDEGKDGFYLSNQLCSEEENSYRTFRLINHTWISYFENCSNLILIQNNFNSHNFYLWNIDYHLFSGKYPKYILDDGFHFYKDSYLSLDQGYPEIPFFKTFQKPEGLWPKFNKARYQAYLDEKFTNIPYQPAYTYIYSQPELNDQKVKDYTLHQDSENEGALALSSFEISELPNVWQNLTIKRQGAAYQYDLPQKLNYQRILPSLWRVTFEPGSTSKPLLLVFNEGYDRQWQAYRTFLDLLLGREAKEFNHLKFNGYANAWEANKPEAGRFYLFYTPERLAILGWLITLLTILTTTFILFRAQAKSKR